MTHCAGCTCKPKRRRAYYPTFEEAMRRHAEKGQVVTTFSLRPRRDPETGKWFWLRQVTLRQTGSVRFSVLGWGMGVIPYIEWKTVGVAGVAQG